MKSCKELTAGRKEGLDALRYQEEIKWPTRGERIAAKIIGLSILAIVFFAGFLVSRFWLR